MIDIVRLGNLVEYPYDFKIISYENGNELPKIIRGKKAIQIKRAIKNLRGFTRMLLNQKVIIERI